MAKQERRHLAYLIKFWQVHSEGKRVWQGSLEDAHTGQKRGFGDPAGLFAFLQAKLGLGPGLAEDNDPALPGRTEKPEE